MAAYKYSYCGMSTFFKNSADVAGPICQALRESPGGLTPKSLVDASRDENAPLHNEFEWDDNIAAEKYREEQAACIIRHIMIVRTDIQEIRQTRDRAFVSKGENDNAYVPLNEALSTEKWRNNLLKQARIDAERFTNKYHRLTELANVIKAMNEFLDDEAS